MKRKANTNIDDEIGIQKGLIIAFPIESSSTSVDSSQSK